MESNNIRTGAYSVWQCHVHIVLFTRCKSGVLTPEVLEECERVMKETCAQNNSTLVEFAGEEDNVHLLVEFSPSADLASLVNSLKGNSAKRLSNTHSSHLCPYLEKGPLWSRSHYCGTVGGAPVDVVREYIEQHQGSEISVSV